MISKNMGNVRQWKNSQWLCGFPRVSLCSLNIANFSPDCSSDVKCQLLSGNYSCDEILDLQSTLQISAYFIIFPSFGPSKMGQTRTHMCQAVPVMWGCRTRDTQRDTLWLTLVDSEDIDILKGVKNQLTTRVMEDIAHMLHVWNIYQHVP